MTTPTPGVLFDVDGTLLDTNYLHVLAWWQALRETGHPGIAMSAVHRAIGIASEGLVERLLGEPDQASVEAHSRRFEALRDQVVAFPATADLVEACAGRGWKPVLATSGKQDDLDWMLPAIGAEGAVAGATTSSEVGSGKPAPDLLTGALREHDLDPARSVVVGDTVWDVEAAEKAGLPCVGLLCGGISAAELRAAGAVAVYDDPADLLDHLDELDLG
jgi:phosphoglycolate phosphatase-like HAD superfamily hydrolase